MPSTQQVLRILIASPNDLSRDRDAIEKTIHNWNAEHADVLGVYFRPIRWERDSLHTSGQHPQDAINEQLVAFADVIIGTFWTMLGSPTGRADSGTVEEIELGINQGKHVMLYFCRRPVDPDKLSQEQWQRLQEFKQSQRSNSLYATYRTKNQLTEQLSRDLTKLAHKLGKNETGTAMSAQHQPGLDRVPSPGSTPVQEAGPRKQLEEDAAITEMVRQKGNDSPLLTGLIRREIGNSACVNLDSIGTFKLTDDRIIIPFKLVNAGRHPAKRLVFSVHRDDEHLVSISEFTPLSLRPGEATSLFSFSVVRAQWIQDFEQWQFDVRASFEDGLGEQQVHYVIRMEGVDPNFKIWEDHSKAIFNPHCQYSRR